MRVSGLGQAGVEICRAAEQREIERIKEQGPRPGSPEWELRQR